MTRVILIGAGGMGKMHAAAYAALPDVQVVGIADIRLEQAHALAEKMGARAYSTPDELLRKEKADIADVCTPSYLHSQHVSACLRRGLHVLCEKPLALKTSDAARMVRLANQRGRLLMAAQVVRFWPEFVYLRQALQKNMYGDLRQLFLTRIGGTPRWSWQGWFLDPARSGLAPYDLHIHDLDFIVHLLGKPAAVQSQWLQSEDRFTSYIKTRYEYPAPILVEAESGWYHAAYPFSAGFRAVFEAGILSYRDNQLTFYPAEGEAQSIHLDALSLGADAGINLNNAGPYFTEIAYFVDCVRSGKLVDMCPPQESVEVLQVLGAELKSAASKKIVKLNGQATA